MALSSQNKQLLETLSNRFQANLQRHPTIAWTDVASQLTQKPKYLKILQAMESTGGEPDVVVLQDGTGEIAFIDCSPESPTGRRSLCYDDQALDSRKVNKPNGSAVGTAGLMGIELLTEDWYRYLQTLGEFDLKTSSWIETPNSIRQLGGALFCDRRFGQVFTYHNGAESYYAARGFRGVLFLQ